jgi:hypothetical protein
MRNPRSPQEAVDLAHRGLTSAYAYTNKKLQKGEGFDVNIEKYLLEAQDWRARLSKPKTRPANQREVKRAIKHGASVTYGKTSAP